MSENKEQDKLVYTVKDRCRTCYTCVRECPAKAIKIINGQAQVIPERCIGCGNCIRVCSQLAKSYRRSIDQVYDLLESENQVAAIVAPSFPAEFIDFDDYKEFVGSLKVLGFDFVCEVSFGADLVARKYKDLFEMNSGNRFISADCPAIVSYISNYYPKLVNHFAPIASPMVATSRVIKKKYGEGLKVVFIGPCIAKKDESDEIDEVVTFAELRKMFQIDKVSQKVVEPMEFDPPLSGKGAVFPISRGLMQTIDISDNAVESDIIVAEGRTNFQEAIKEFDAGLINTNHLELLCCEGCIMGAGMSVEGKRYKKSNRVAEYARQKLESFDDEQWDQEMNEYSQIDLSREYHINDQRISNPTRREIAEVLKKMGKNDVNDHLDCGACGYDTCEEHAIAIIKGLAETEMCLPYSIEKLHKSINELAVSNKELASVQQTLKQTEKLAHMGQLSAGIAHELNNPLGVLIMYSNLLLDETPDDSQHYNDLNLIVEQANRCKKIVSGLLNFARKNQLNTSEVNAVHLVQQCIDAVIVPKNINLVFEHTLRDSFVHLDSEQMIQVITNLMKNAIDAMPRGGSLIVRIDEDQDHMLFTIKDNGTGISQEDQEKIFEPFFTTKKIGMGTGLGLATAYGIVKMHKGDITVESNDNPDIAPTGTKFIIKIPRNHGT